MKKILKNKVEYFRTHKNVDCDLSKRKRNIDLIAQETELLGKLFTIFKNTVRSSYDGNILQLFFFIIKTLFTAIYTKGFQ